MEPRANRRTTPVRVDPVHAVGKRKRGPAPKIRRPATRGHDATAHHQPWIPTSGLVGRTRRSARRS